MLAFSNDYYELIFRATQSVELFYAYSIETNGVRTKGYLRTAPPEAQEIFNDLLLSI